jgi:hypothetical protein
MFVAKPTPGSTQGSIDDEHCKVELDDGTKIQTEETMPYRNVR